MFAVTPIVLQVMLCASPYANRVEAAEVVARGAPEAENAIEALVDAGRPGLWALDARLKRASGPAKARILAALGRWKTQEAEFVLRRELSNGGPQIKIGALTGLGALGTASATRAIVDNLTHADDDVRRAAGEALIAVGPSATRRARMLLDDSAAEARRAAVRFFAIHADDRTLDGVLDRMLDDRAPIVVVAALEASVARNRTRDAKNAALLQDHREGVAVATARTVAATANGDEARALARTLASNRLREDVRAAMLAALRAEASARSYEILVDAAALETEARAEAIVRRMAADADDAEIGVLIDLLASRYRKRVRIASRVLREIGAPVEERALRALVRGDVLLREPLHALVLAAPRDRMREKIRTMLASDEVGAKVAALDVVARMADIALVPVVVRACDDARRPVRLAAIAALGSLPTTRSRRALVRALEDDDEPVHTAAIRALGRTPTLERMDTLVAALDDDRKSVRLAAIDALSPPVSAPILDRLVALLERGSPEERERIVRGIANSTASGADRVLIDLVTHHEVGIRRVAVAVVEQSDD